MDANIEVRHDLRPGDLGRVLHLHGVVYAKEEGFDLTFEGYVAGTLGHFASPIDLDQERLWLAEVDGQLVGSVAIVKHSGEVAQLRWLLVDPAFRGHGLGRRLIEEAIAFVRAAGYGSVFLDTVKELSVAAALYRSAGFSLVSEEARGLWGRELTEQRYELQWRREAASMSDQASLLHAILANPDDQALRLVYADWLEDHDDMRGEFLRLQCELAALGEQDPRREDLEGRESELVAAHGEGWFGPLMRVVSEDFRVSDSGIAWLLFMHPTDAIPSRDPLQAATVWRGEVEQNETIFRTVMHGLSREGNVIRGEMACDFGYGVGEWTYEGVVIGPRMAYITDRKSGSVTYPGLYAGKVEEASITGRWQVPSYYQEGDFGLRRTDEDAGTAP